MEGVPIFDSAKLQQLQTLPVQATQSFMAQAAEAIVCCQSLDGVVKTLAEFIMALRTVFARRPDTREEAVISDMKIVLSLLEQLARERTTQISAIRSAYVNKLLVCFPFLKSPDYQRMVQGGIPC